MSRYRLGQLVNRIAPWEAEQLRLSRRLRQCPYQRVLASTFAYNQNFHPQGFSGKPAADSIPKRQGGEISLRWKFVDARNLLSCQSDHQANPTIHTRHPPFGSDHPFELAVKGGQAPASTGIHRSVARIPTSLGQELLDLGLNP